MSLRLVSGVAIAAIALSACEPVANEPPPPPPTEATGQAALEQEVESPSEPEIVPAQEVTDNLPKVQTAKIEWAKARQDFAAQNMPANCSRLCQFYCQPADQYRSRPAAQARALSKPPMAITLFTRMKTTM